MRFDLILLVLNFLGIILFTALSPVEKTHGANVRVVYLHGALVWSAMAAFLAAALAGLVGLLSGRITMHRWSLALGRAGLVFWIAYLPVSVWAMQTSWNGLFLAEPRWRLGVSFAIVGLLLQTGLALVRRPAWASAGNLAYAASLLVALMNTRQVMHPPSPILDSDSWRIQLFFLGLLALSLLAAGQVARWWLRLVPVEASE
jgi:hypothetical protein